MIFIRHRLKSHTDKLHKMLVNETWQNPNKSKESEFFEFSLFTITSGEKHTRIQMALCFFLGGQMVLVCRDAIDL